MARQKSICFLENSPDDGDVSYTSVDLKFLHLGDGSFDSFFRSFRSPNGFGDGTVGCNSLPIRRTFCISGSGCENVRLGIVCLAVRDCVSSDMERIVSGRRRWWSSVCMRLRSFSIESRDRRRCSRSLFVYHELSSLGQYSVYGSIGAYPSITWTELTVSTYWCCGRSSITYCGCGGFWCWCSVESLTMHVLPRNICCVFNDSSSSASRNGSSFLYMVSAYAFVGFASS